MDDFVDMKDRRGTTASLPPEFDTAVAWAAWLYYVDGLNQNDVARAMNVSRASVVNYLQEARESGLVVVDIDHDAFARTSVSRRLMERFSLAGTTVIPDLDGTDPSRRIGEAAGRLLASLIKPGDTIGVAWGRTVLAAARSIPQTRRSRDLTVVQLSGSSMATDDFSPEFCTSLMANRLGARCVNLLAPAIVSTQRLRDELMREPMLVKQFGMIGEAEKIIFGIGDIGPESTFARTELGEAVAVERMAAKGAVGVIIGRFIDAEGRQVRDAIDERTVGITLEQLKCASIRICAAGGPRKTEALRAGLLGGYATHLVTDMKTARMLLE